MLSSYWYVPLLLFFWFLFYWVQLLSILLVSSILISIAVICCSFFWYFDKIVNWDWKPFLILFWPWRLSRYVTYCILYFFIVSLLKSLKISFRKYQENWIKTTSNPDLDWVFRYLFESLDYISHRIFKMVTPKSCWEKTGKYLW